MCTQTAGIQPRLELASGEEKLFFARKAIRQHHASCRTALNFRRLAPSIMAMAADFRAPCAFVEEGK